MKTGGGGARNPRSLSNLEPETCNVTHGAFRWLSRSLTPPCRMCIAKDQCDAFEEQATCRLAEDHQAMLVETIMGLGHIEETDRPLVLEYAKLNVALAVIDHYLANSSPFLDGANANFVEAQPILSRTRMTISNSMVRLATCLGLSPESRKRIDRGRAEIVWLRDEEVDADE